MSDRRESSRSLGVVKQAAVCGHDHRAENLLGACRGCSNARRWPETWTIYLGGFGQTVAGADARARAQLAAPLDYTAGRILARRWHPGRLEALRRYDGTYRLRRAGVLPPVTAFPLEGAAA